jgi:DNA-binding NarL/FixJ family response regulator
MGGSEFDREMVAAPRNKISEQRLRGKPARPRTNSKSLLSKGRGEGMRLRILLADGHALVRAGLRVLLEAEAGVEVVGQAGDGWKAIELVDRLRPDIVVIELKMPGLDGLEVAREVARRCPESRVVILSTSADEASVVEAFRSGAAAYVLKQAEPSQLVQAIEEAAAGRLFLSFPLSERAIETYLRWAEGRPPDPLAELTRRERQVLQLVAQGMTSAAIADLLFVSRRTIESHRASVLRKLHARNGMDVIRFAVSRGLVSADGEPESASWDHSTRSSHGSRLSVRSSTERRIP